MATNKKSSSSKTARVMNLLSKSREEAPVEQTSAAAPEVQDQAVQPAPVAEATPAPAPAPAPTHTTPLISSMQADSAISNQVMSALESALEDELSEAQEGAAPTPAAPVESETTVEAEPVVAQAEEDIVEEPVVEKSVEAQSEIAPPPVETVSASVEPAPAAHAQAETENFAEPAPPTRFQIDADTTYVNVMETLVEEKANKYIDLFGLCKCPRCVADVKAYALNHLNPKYVVMRTGEVIPRITVYENQFSAVVTAQILNACKIVMSSPRHDQP